MLINTQFVVDPAVRDDTCRSGIDPIEPLDRLGQLGVRREVFRPFPDDAGGFQPAGVGDGFEKARAAFVLIAFEAQPE
jgi:hypothetical protein